MLTKLIVLDNNNNIILYWTCVTHLITKLRVEISYSSSRNPGITKESTRESEKYDKKLMGIQGNPEIGKLTKEF